jgi:ABC-type antimicrobial peptide transport system permease subunit
VSLPAYLGARRLESMRLLIAAAVFLALWGAAIVVFVGLSGLTGGTAGLFRGLGSMAADATWRLG